jgi:hypothetical protein
MSVSPSTTRSGQARLARFGLLALVLAAAAGLALLASACGGSSGAEVAQVDSTTTETTTTGSGSRDGSNAADPAAYSACMRSHGVPKYPDPDSEGRILLEARPGSGIDPESAQFKAAAKACEKLAPREGNAPSPAQQAKDRKQMLKFAACMRSHGLRTFPDPKVSGGGVSLSLRNTGLDPDSPQFKTAEKACETLIPGRAGSGGGEDRTS